MGVVFFFVELMIVGAIITSGHHQTYYIIIMYTQHTSLKNIKSILYFYDIITKHCLVYVFDKNNIAMPE